MTRGFIKGGKCGVDVSYLKINDVLECNPHYVQSGSTVLIHHIVPNSQGLIYLTVRGALW